MVDHIMARMLTTRTIATAIVLSSIAGSSEASSSSFSCVGSRSGFAVVHANRRRRLHHGATLFHPPHEYAGGSSPAHRLDLYRKFHDYAWDALTVTLAVDDENHDDVPERLRSNTSPVKNAPNGTSVVASVRSMSRFPFLGGTAAVVPISSSSSSSPGTTSTVDDDGTGADGRRGQALRLSRTAFLETQTPTGEALITNMTIHVLNFVSFPNPRIRRRCTRDDDDTNDGGYLGLPIFGADIVSLPGNKHLVALDFQPVLPLHDIDGEEGGGKKSPLFPEGYSNFDDKLHVLHSKYQGEPDDIEPPLLPWGGDIPQKATRFFSPHALWTRLGDVDAMDTVRTVVWDAFREYTDLYMELMKAVQEDVNSGILEVVATPAESGIDINNPVWRGQMDYLEYRRTNDPARPMLQRLYGSEWSESVISEVLFPDL
jgi:hypothetical protein